MKRIAFASLALAAACGDTTKYPPDTTVFHLNYAAAPNPDLDVLFVMGDDNGIVDVGQTFAASMSKLVAQLDQSPGGRPNLHVGVVTPDLGTLGASSATPAPALGNCVGSGDDGDLRVGGPTGFALSGSASFVIDVADGSGGRTTNYPGDLGQAVGALTELGGQGCGFQQNFEAMKQALDGNPTDVGFVRASARLAIVMFADEDDCSVANSAFFDPNDDGGLGPVSSFRCTQFGVACDSPPDDLTTPGTRTGCHPLDDSPYLTTVSDYISFVQGLKPNARDVIVAVDTGDPTPFVITSLAGGPELAPACTSPAGGAQPGVRLNAFATALGDRGLATSLCGDQSTAADAIGAFIRQAPDAGCLPAGAPDTCAVADVVVPNAPIELPACDPGADNPPCWHVVVDTQQCAATPSHLQLVVERGGQPAPADDHVVADCSVPAT